MTEPATAAVRPSPPWSAQVLGALLVRSTARLGLAWIALLALVAAFAPFLANSHPLYMVVDGQRSFPAFSHLQAADLTWLAGLVLALFAWRVRGPVFLRFAGWFVAVTVVGYRELEAAGRVEAVVRAPIPYSAKDYLRDYGDTGIEAPLLGKDGRTHWFGTEDNGADVAARMIEATRIALGIGFIATGIALVIGTIIGGLMGYFSGVVDIIGMRLVEIFEAIPTLFLLLTFVAFFGRSIYMMMIIIGITSWSGYARYVRAEFLRLREQDFVQAAIASGLPLRSILFRHMLPNGVAPLLVAASFGVASAILAETTLSFLGLGLVDDPSWGQLLNQAVQSSTFNWWLAVFPGGAIFLTVFAYNLVGEALRDAVDPHTQRSGRAR
jgi:peptide/nickel transport system permease protein